MCNTIPSNSYGFRKTTQNNHIHTHESVFCSIGRKILPLELTPSLKNNIGKREIDVEISKIKAEYRIHHYFITAIAENIFELSLKREKTTHQGSKASRGYQAAHSSLQPSTSDDNHKKLIKKINEFGITPLKTKPFLKSKIGLTSPESKILDEGRKDPEFINTFISKKLPIDGNHSVFSGTHYNCCRNATFENPDESNQYDSLLERTIEPFLKQLQENRCHKKETAENSTESLVNWLNIYYRKSISNLKQKIEDLNNAHSHFEKMRAFELKYLTDEDVPAGEFADYLKSVDAFLEHYDSLIEKKEGCPPCSELKSIRNDFRFLKKLRTKAYYDSTSLKNAKEYYLNSRYHLGKTNEMQFDLKTLLEKLNLYLSEARAQKQAMKELSEPCSILQLKKQLFGIKDGEQRRLPDEEELKNQIFELCKPITPFKPKSANASNNKENASPQATTPMNKTRKKQIQKYSS